MKWWIKSLIISLGLSIIISFMGYYCINSCNGFGCFFCLPFMFGGIIAGYILNFFGAINLESYFINSKGIIFHLFNFLLIFLLALFNWSLIFYFIDKLKPKNNLGNNKKDFELMSRRAFIFTLIGGILTVISAIIYLLLNRIVLFSIFRLIGGTILITLAFYMRKTKNLKILSIITIIISITCFELISLIGGILGTIDSKNLK